MLSKGGKSQFSPLGVARVIRRSTIDDHHSSKPAVNAPETPNRNNVSRGGGTVDALGVDTMVDSLGEGTRGFATDRGLPYIPVSPYPTVGLRPFARPRIDVLAEEPEAGTAAAVQRLHRALCRLIVAHTHTRGEVNTPRTRKHAPKHSQPN